MVFNKVIVWVGDPETGGCLIRVKQRPTSLCHHDQVALNEVLLLNCIFDKDDMTLDIEGNIVQKTKVMSSMKSESPIEALMCSHTFAVRLVHGTNHVEMHCISSHLECLSNLIHLNVFQSCNQRVIA